MSYADKTLTCRDCGQAFTFSAGEQEFYASRGFTNEPSRCPDCRAARKASRGGGSYDSYSSGGSYSSGYGQSGYNKRGTKHSTSDAIARMDYESPAPQNIAITKEEDKNAR